MYQDVEGRREILLPFKPTEGRLVGLRALQDTNTFWFEGSYQAIMGFDKDYGDRWGAVGLRLANLWLDIGKPQEVQQMLNRFVDDGSRDHARDRTLLLYGDYTLRAHGVTHTAESFSMITSPRLRDDLFGRSIIRTAMTEYGQEEIDALAYMLAIHLEGLRSPRWGGNEQEKRIPLCDWQKGINRPLLSPLFIDIPQTKHDLEQLYGSVINLGKGLDRIELMISLSEILLHRCQATDDEVITQIQKELDRYMQQSDVGREIMKLWQDDIPKGSVFSWIDIIQEAQKLERLGLVPSSRKQQGQEVVHELLNGEKIWKLVAKQRALTDVLGSLLQTHATGNKITPEVLTQGLAAYGIGYDEGNRNLISQILLTSIPHATMRDDQWIATAERLLSYVEAVQLFNSYDREYLDIDSMGNQLLEVRFTNLHNLGTAINTLIPEQKNQALLSFYRFGTERIRILANYNFNWSRPDILKILSQLETLPVESIGAFLQYHTHN